MINSRYDGRYDTSVPWVSKKVGTMAVIISQYNGRHDDGNNASLVVQEHKHSIDADSAAADRVWSWNDGCYQ